MTAVSRNTALLRADGLTKSFGEVRALRGVSLELTQGEMHAVLGENGAGKSTLIGVLTGVHRPSAGTITIDGQDAPLHSPRDALRHGIVAVLQRSNLVPELSIRDNFRLTGQPLPCDPDLAVETLEQITGTTFDLTARVGEFDFGTRAQIEIARAVARRPRVLILDEPTAQLDADGSARLLQLLAALRERGTAVVLVTHKLAEVLEYADAFTVLRQGGLVFSASRAELLRGTQAEAEAALLQHMFGDAHRTSANPGPDGARAGTQEHPTVLELSGLSTRDEVGQRGLTGIDLSVRGGEILAVAGILGNGQSHLAGLLEGSRVPFAGSITLNAQDVTRVGVRERRKLGMRLLTDDRFGVGLVSSLSVALNLVLDRIGSAPFWRNGFLRSPALRERAKQLIAEAGIAVASPDTPAGTLSGGNAQKILLARDADIPVQVYVYNQPTYGLDVATVQTIHAAIRARAQRGEAVVLISADIDEIVTLADRVVVLHAGQITASFTGKTAALREQLGRALVGVTQ